MRDGYRTKAVLVFALSLATFACGHPAVTRDPQGDPVVTDAASATAAKGLQANVTGTARNAKLGAVVVLSDGVPVYCPPLQSWPTELDGRPLHARGVLELTDEFVAGNGAAGTTGAVWVLRDCKYIRP